MSSPEPSFQAAGHGAFWLRSATGVVKTIGFQAPPGATLPDSPTLAQTWAVAGGLYFFLAEPAAEESVFLEQLAPYLSERGWPQGPRFLWLQASQGPREQWVGQVLSLTATGAVRAPVDFALGGYQLTVAAGSSVALAGEAQGWGFVFSGNPPEATLFAPGGEYPIAAAPLRLPLAGPTPGCWLLKLSLTAGGETEDDFRRLGVGIRYFCPDPGKEEEKKGQGQSVHVRALELPTLVQPASPLTLDAVIDPLRPLDSDRTHLSLFGGGAPGAWETTFATARGHGVTLKPLAAAGSVPDARFSFAVQPLFVGPGSVPTEFYLTPEGPFEIGWVSAGEPGIRRVLCGSSGLEYLGIDPATPTRVLFKPGGAAFAPLAASSDADQQPLSHLGTTAWVTLAADAPGAHYYAQPEEAPLFKAPGAAASDSIGTSFLEFLESPAQPLPADGSGPAFPVAPLRGLAPAGVALAKQLESAGIAPARRRALLPVERAGGGHGEDAPLTEAVGVTPQGFGVGIGGDGESWSWLGIANDAEATVEKPDLRFSRVAGRFRAAMQTNRLFMVLANADEFAKDGSVAYRLTAEGLAELAAAGSIPSAVLAAVKAAFEKAGYPTCETEAEFEAALLAASSGAQEYLTEFRRVAGLLTPTIEGWRFQLSPRNWTEPGRQAFLVFKLARGRTLRDLVGDLTAWSWAAAAAPPKGKPADAQEALLQIFADAEAAHASTTGPGGRSPYENVVTLIDDPGWTGVIAFNCAAPLSGLPEPLQALAAGIEPKRFHAHHIGFDLTPFGAEPGRLRFGRSSAFGLVDYRDESDQYAEENVPYAFKTQRLTVGFRNSAIVDFSARVQLLINRLFGATARLYPTEHGNNVILDGVYQRQLAPDGTVHGSYVFSANGQNRVQTEASALREAVLRSAHLVTTRPAPVGDLTAPVVATFSFGGDLRFYEPADCDPFSFGPKEEPPEGEASLLAPPQSALDPVPQPAESGLRFDGLGIAMTFTLAEPKPSFGLVTETLSFDPANSRPRPDSLFARFPLRLQGLLATPDPQLGLQPPPPAENPPESSQPPKARGFTPINAPLQQSLMADPWYGLLYELDLGTLGALAGAAKLTLGLLVAWSAGGSREEPAVFLGVQLPGTREGLGARLPLEGALSLSFRAIELAAVQGTGGREYLLRLRNLALRVLGISLPPGHTDITLFANPDQAPATKLGWYAAYSAEQDPKRRQRLTQGAGRP